MKRGRRPSIPLRAVCGSKCLQGAGTGDPPGSSACDCPAGREWGIGTMIRSCHARPRDRECRVWAPCRGCGVMAGLLWTWAVAPSCRCRIGPPYWAYEARSGSLMMIGLGAHAIVRLSDSVGVIYMWANSACLVAQGVAADRSLSPRTAGDSYTPGKEYSSGSVSRPPGRAALYLRTPDISCITANTLFSGLQFPSFRRSCRGLSQYPVALSRSA